MSTAFAPAGTVQLSVLDLAPLSAGQSVGEAIEASARLAELADRTGYKRFWYAEHHNNEGVASSATTVLIGHAAARTSRIRIGAGGVMLPNHAPLVVAEQFGTLANMYPDRIDLGLGRAPGTDPRTAAMLRRGDSSGQAFAGEIVELQQLFGAQEGTLVRAVTARNTQVPMCVLGSSTGGAAVAALLGLPFAAASHFAPQSLNEAVAVYRQNFNPAADTAQIAEPYVIAGVNVLVAGSQEEAEFQFSSHRLLVRDIVAHGRRPVQPPVPDVMAGWQPEEAAQVRARMAASAVGTPETVRAQLERLAGSAGIDELMVVTYAWDPAVRERSYELLAGAWGLG
ncbi:LLM class flavin-dependent oxidoreductase [Arthrobacter mobilis]|uniref:LLM class flavin-dependent oxidoreductase n=1 Tax=Arthrobacter mobilis TaxID=2724944 RepID=A0A7X6HDD6_9MICC|nr:LLM class flavin-dependent oxidoreductase [Arthrobacter mobilis]NKX55054.1 LLM class flavin-dependent oxidoreductase [Arthrobacter mobilis]